LPRPRAVTAASGARGAAARRLRARARGCGRGAVRGRHSVHEGVADPRRLLVHRIPERNLLVSGGPHRPLALPRTPAPRRARERSPSVPPQRGRSKDRSARGAISCHDCGMRGATGCDHSRRFAPLSMGSHPVPHLRPTCMPPSHHYRSKPSPPLCATVPACATGIVLVSRPGGGWHLGADGVDGGAAEVFPALHALLAAARGPLRTELVHRQRLRLLPAAA
jgi:hypothetical protein